MSTIQGNILNFRTFITTIKDYGSMPELNGFQFEIGEKSIIKLTDEQQKIFEMFLRKLSDNIFAYNQSKELSYMMYTSKVSEITFIFAFGVILCTTIITILCIVIYFLLKGKKICLDEDYYGADCMYLERANIKCKNIISEKDKIIKEEEMALKSQLDEATRQYTKTIEDYNKATDAESMQKPAKDNQESDNPTVIKSKPHTMIVPIRNLVSKMNGSDLETLSSNMYLESVGIYTIDHEYNKLYKIFKHLTTKGSLTDEMKEYITQIIQIKNDDSLQNIWDSIKEKEILNNSDEQFPIGPSNNPSEFFESKGGSNDDDIVQNKLIIKLKTLVHYVNKFTNTSYNGIFIETGKYQELEKSFKEVLKEKKINTPNNFTINENSNSLKTLEYVYEILCYLYESYSINIDIKHNNINNDTSSIIEKQNYLKGIKKNHQTENPIINSTIDLIISTLEELKAYDASKIPEINFTNNTTISPYKIQNSEYIRLIQKYESRIDTIKESTNLKKLSEMSDKLYGNITLNPLDIKTYIEFRYTKKFVRTFLGLFTGIAIVSVGLVIIIIWFQQQKKNADKTLNIDIVRELNGINMSQHVVEVMKPLNITLNDDNKWNKFVKEIPEVYVRHLQILYNEYDKVVEKIDKFDIISMIKKFDQSASSIDSFMLKSNDPVENVNGTLSSEEKMNVIKSEIIPLFGLQCYNIIGVRYFDRSVNYNVLNLNDMGSPNRINKLKLQSNVLFEDIRKMIDDSNYIVLSRIISLLSDPNFKFIFATLDIYKPDNSYTIDLIYLYLDKMSDFNGSTFDKFRDFTVSKKSNDDVIISSTWFSTTTLGTFKGKFNKDINTVGQSTSNFVTVINPVVEEEETGEEEYFLNVFTDGSSERVFDGTRNILSMLINDQPYIQVNTYHKFKENISNKIFEKVKSYDYMINISEFTDKMFIDLDKLNISPLLSSDLRQIFLSIFMLVEKKVNESKVSKDLKDDYISFERFKEKYSELTIDKVSNNFGYNLLLMKSYGLELKNNFEVRDTYIPNALLGNNIYRLFVILVIILGSCWYIYFVGFDIYKYISFEYQSLTLRKINFLLNYQLISNSDDTPVDKTKRRKPPVLSMPTGIELGKNIIKYAGVYILLIGSILIMVFCVLYANYTKSENIILYNHNILLSNTLKILNGVETSLYYLTLPNNNLKDSPPNFGFHNLNYSLSNGKTLDEKYASPIITATNDVNKVEKIISNNADAWATQTVKLDHRKDKELKIIYDSLVDMLISYKNENSILMMKNIGLMFPYVDIITNGVLLIVAVFMIITIISKLNPLSLVNSAKQYRSAIESNDIELIECMLDEENKLNDINNMIILSSIIVIVIFFVTLSISKTLSSGRNYGYMLYNSTMYDNRMGYNIKQ